MEAEAIGLLEAIKTTIEKGHYYVEFETDCKPVVDALSLPATSHSELGDIISQCKSLIANNSDYAVLFVQRQANKIVHSIARLSLSNPSSVFFV